MQFRACAKEGRRTLPWILVLPTLTLGALASAQSTSSDPASSASALEEIVVTAQRRTERLEDVPMAITAVSAEALQNAGVVGVQDLGAVAAGVQVNFGGAFTAPSVRGVTTLTNGNNIENNIAIYVDGFYEPNPLAINSDLPNIAGVEVLKGPQGTLYGRNATGGAILINTLAPSETFTGKGELTYGRYEDQRVSAHLSGPLGERVRASVSGYYRDTDGYVKFADPARIGETAGDTAPMRQEAVRTKFEFDVTDTFTATLAYNYAYVNDPRGNLFSTFEYVSPFLPPPPQRPTKLGAVAYNYETQTPVTTNQGTLKLAWQTGIGALTSYTGYANQESRVDFDFDGTYADITSTTIRFEQDTYQQALDFAIDAIENLDLIVGALYFKDENETGPEGIQTFGGGRTLSIKNIAGQDTDAWAVYADGTYQLADKWSVNVGGRYSSEEKQVDFTSISFATNPEGVIALGPLHREAKFSKFTPRASIRYEIAPRTNVYLAYSKGFRSGTFSLSPPADPALYNPVRDETIDAYEVGFKTAGSMFRFDAAAFYYDYQDLHVNVAARSPLCPPGPCGLIITLFQNAPKAEIYGFDAQVAVTPVDNLTLRGGIALLHARYKDFPNATGNGLNATLTANQTQAQDWSDQQMARAPDVTGNVGIDYEVPMGEGGLLFAANANYTDSYVINNPSLFGNGPSATTQRYRQSGYTLVNASATWTLPSGDFYIGAYGRNLTDKQYRITYSGGAFGDYGSPSEPRTYGVRAGYRF